jgi:hypothetical protein
MRSLRKSLPSVLLIGLLSTGCDSERLSQFGAFAAAGSAYVSAFHAFTHEAGTAFIAADSATLIKARNLAGADVVAANRGEFRKRVAEEDDLMKDYLTNLRKLDTHATLLGNYFNAVSKLTNGNAASSTITSVDSLLDSINSFNPQIENATFGDKKVKDYLGTATELIVAHFEAKALNRELQKSAPVIQKALALQAAAIKALQEQMKPSLVVSLQAEESTEVLDPYVSKNALPNSWASEREAYLRQDVNLHAADAAQNAIESLQDSFSDLVTNPKAKIDLSVLLNEIGKMASYASSTDDAVSAGKV